MYSHVSLKYRVMFLRRICRLPHDAQTSSSIHTILDGTASAHLGSVVLLVPGLQASTACCFTRYCSRQCTRLVIPASLRTHRNPCTVHTCVCVAYVIKHVFEENIVVFSDCILEKPAVRGSDNVDNRYTFLMSNRLGKLLLDHYKVYFRD